MDIEAEALIPDVLAKDAGNPMFSNAFDQSDIYATSVPLMEEVEVPEGDGDGDDFDGSGEGLEEDLRDDETAQVVGPDSPPDSEYLDNPDSMSTHTKFRSSTPKYVLDHFNLIKEKYFTRAPGVKSAPLYDRYQTFWVPQQDPAFLHPNQITPERLFNPQFFLWDPISLQPVIPCPICSSTLVCHGVLHSPRRVVDLYDCYWLIGARYACSACKAHNRQYTFVSWDHKILSSLPKWLMVSFPAVLTHRSGMDVHLFNHMKLSFQSGVGAKQFSDGLRAAHKEHFHKIYLQYLSLILKGLAFHQLQKTTFPDFGSFDSEYAGFVPSARWLRNLYDADVMKETPILDQQMSMISICIGATDHSHKVNT